MTAKRIMQAVSSMFKGMWIRHQLTLGLLVAATFSSRRLTVTALGRFLSTRTAPCCRAPCVMAIAAGRWMAISGVQG